MSKKIVALALAAFVACSHAVYAQDAAQAKEALAAARAREKIESTGAGERVEVKLRDGKKVKGLVGELAQDHFTVVDRKTGAETTVRYAQVKGVQNRFVPKRLKVASLIIIGALAPVFVAAGVVLAKGGQ